MLFNSYIFVLFFLPICLIGYFLLNRFNLHKFAQGYLLGMSLWFYGYFNANYLWIIIISICINYLCYWCMTKSLNQRMKKGLMIMGVTINIGILFYYKYFDFFLDNINDLFKTSLPLLNIVLPLGISFFTFQQISFVVDSYKGEIPKYSILSYAGFVTFFPQLVAGPIVTHHELIPQFEDKAKKRLNWDNLSEGVYLFTLGLGKKVLLADILGNAVNYGFSMIDYLNSTEAIVVMLSYTLQIYFDFSGYCDMAIGIGKMFNIDLPLNFNSPYKAKTITEFWDRWHMTLTRFLTGYIYIPLGGNRKGTVRTYVNIFIVFLLSGLWHGANWTFILWGVCHGIFSILTRMTKKYIDKIPGFIQWIVTFIFLNVTWTIFRADSILDAVRIIKIAFSGEFARISESMAQSVWIVENNIIETVLTACTGYDLAYKFPEWVLLLVITIGFIFIALKKNAYEKMKIFKPTFMNVFVTAVLLVWCICSFAGVSTFLYFNF